MLVMNSVVGEGLSGKRMGFLWSFICVVLLVLEGNC